MWLLDKANTQDPVVESLKQLLYNVQLVPVPGPNLYTVTKAHLCRRY